MTVIELIDSAPIHNILGFLTFKADKIIYVGSLNHEKFQKRHRTIINRFLEKKGITDIEPEYVNVKKNDFNDIYVKLSEIVKNNDDCYFDISGGEDMTLSALGFVFAENKQVKLYQANPISERIYIFSHGTDEEGNFIIEKSVVETDIKNTVEENIIIHGGTVVYDTETACGTHTWKYPLGFCNDIDSIWNFCCNGPKNKNHVSEKDAQSFPRLWNRVAISVASLDSLCSVPDPELELIVPEVNAAARFGDFSEVIYDYLVSFEAAGLISFGAKHSKKTWHVIYKNMQVKQCLTKSGMVLEQKTYLACENLIKDEFSDCMTGVYIDWDGIVHHRNSPDEACVSDTSNEIDVMFMKGVIPYFISCKNGKFTADELYKLYTVKERFGTQYGKMFIIATDFEHNMESNAVNYLKQRAADMDITIIRNVHKMSNAEFEETLEKRLK